MVRTTERSQHEGSRSAFAKGWDRAQSLLEFGDNDNSAVHDYSGASSLVGFQWCKYAVELASYSTLTENFPWLILYAPFRHDRFFITSDTSSCCGTDVIIHASRVSFALFSPIPCSAVRWYVSAGLDVDMGCCMVIPSCDVWQFCPVATWLTMWSSVYSRWTFTVFRVHFAWSLIASLLTLLVFRVVSTEVRRWSSYVLLGKYVAKYFLGSSTWF